MYVQLVRRVIEEAVEDYAVAVKKPIEDVLAKVAEHIGNTAREHRRDEPQIEYNDPLCRLGYLYMHATANATLFEKVLVESGELRQTIRKATKGVLNVCSIGGGPGTELLGLSKYFVQRPGTAPHKIAFTVVDNVPEWADTWLQIAEAVEEEFQAAGIEPLSIDKTFLPLDAFASSSYRNYAFQFKKADIVVCNYLFSENKDKLTTSQEAWSALHDIISKDCLFVTIDRRENNPQFQTEVKNLFESVFDAEITVQLQGTRLDNDEQTHEMGEMLTATLRRTPRVKFFTDQYRDPTVFWFVVKRQ